jgi:hypothetical protein
MAATGPVTGLLTDVSLSMDDVRFTPESGHCERFYEYTP